MGQIGQIIASTGNVSILNGQRMLTGIPPENFGRFARPGGVLIKSNHPAFVYGHLALYPARVMERLGLPAGGAAMPASYDGLFRNGVECQDDADGKIYPAMAEITQHFFDGYRAAVAAVAEASDAALVAPNPTEGRMRELFPTLGAMLSFYLSGHVQNHLGQVSAWRRAMGMPAA